MNFRKQRLIVKIDNHELDCQSLEEILGIHIDPLHSPLKIISTKFVIKLIKN